MEKITKEQAQAIKHFERLEQELGDLKKSYPEEYKLYLGYKSYKPIRDIHKHGGS